MVPSNKVNHVNSKASRLHRSGGPRLRTRKQASAWNRSGGPRLVRGIRRGPGRMRGTSQGPQLGGRMLGTGIPADDGPLDS